MFIGRREDIKGLEAVYKTDRSNMLVLYGREGIGKTALALRFAQDKKKEYLKFLPASAKDHDLLTQKLLDDLRSGVYKTDEKLVLILDEFHLNESQQVYEALCDVLSREDECGRVMIILISSSINWVENSLLLLPASFAKLITGIIKLQPLSFAEMVEWFSGLPVEDCIIIRAILGGIPKYLKYWKSTRSVKDNVTALFLHPDSPLVNEGFNLLRQELRELNSYNTILIALGKGHIKLNDLYNETGYSRAKISVYIKNLIEIGVVEKLFSANVKNSLNTMKGLYRISDNLLSFYYAFVYPNISQIELGNGERVYETGIKPVLNKYLRPYFADVCREYLDLMSKYKKLDHEYSDWQVWYGKKGIIDIVGFDDSNNVICGLCSFESGSIGLLTFAELKLLVEEAGIKNCSLCLFAKDGFEDDVIEAAKQNNVLTASLEDF